MENAPVLYEERDGIALIAINRPEKKNTLTDAVIQGIADGIDQASRSDEVAAVVLRGVGDTFTAGYDLTAGGDWDNPYNAPRVHRLIALGHRWVVPTAQQHVPSLLRESMFGLLQQDSLVNSL